MIDKISEKINVPSYEESPVKTVSDTVFLATYCNMLTDKINQLIDELAQIGKDVREYEKEHEKNG